MRTIPVSRQYCGVVKYYGIVFDVYWDTEVKTVHVTRANSSAPIDIGFGYSTAETKEEAPGIAITVLKKEFGE